MKNLNQENSDNIWELVELIDELNYKKLELMDEASKKSKVWARVQQHVSENACSDFKEVAASVHDVPEVEADLLTKARVKEMVMEYVENVRVGTGFVFRFNRNFFAAATLMAVMFFSLYPKMPFFPSAFADEGTYIVVEQGTVEVVRGDQVKVVTEDLSLRAGDVIQVLDGSLAQIYFFDDSRMSLAPGTDIAISKLFIDDENRSDTEIEVMVEKGNAWVQVINLTGEYDYFSVLTRDGEVRVDRAASMNVEVSDEEVMVQVVNYLASFEIHGRDGTLGEGTQLLVSGDDIVIEESAIEEDVWFEYNVVEGDKHLRSVTEYYITESADKVKLLSKDPLYEIKKFQETVEKVVSIESAVQKSLDTAESRLAEAEHLISEGEEEEAGEKIQEYLTIVEGLVAEEENTEEVKAQVDQATKGLSVKIVENEELTAIQDVLDEVEETLSEDEKDKSLMKVNNASNKLNTVIDLIDEGSYVEAFENLTAYKEGAFAVASDISDVPEEDRVETISEILTKKIDDLQLLKIIEVKLEQLDEDDPDLEEELADVRQQTLYEINAMVVSLKERALGTISGFLAQVQEDEDMQIQVLNNLKKTVPLDFDIIKKINDLEDVYSSGSGVIYSLSD